MGLLGYHKVGLVGLQGYRMVHTDEHQELHSQDAGQVETARKETLVVETSVTIIY